MPKKIRITTFHSILLTGTAIAFSLTTATSSFATGLTPTLSSHGKKHAERSYKKAFDLAQSDTATDNSAVVKTQLDLAFWNAIKDSDNPGLYRAYLKKFPDGNFVIIAEEKLKALGGSPEPKTTSNGSNDNGETPEPVDNGQNDGGQNAEGNGPQEGSTITENGVGRLNAKTAFTLSAVSKSFDGLEFKKVKRKKSGATVFTAITRDDADVIIMGAGKTVYSLITNARSFSDPNQIRVGDSFAKLAKSVKLDQCLANPFPETFDQPGSVACFNQNSNIAYWFQVGAGKSQKEFAPGKIPKDAKVSYLQWAAAADDSSGEGEQGKNGEDDNQPMPKETQNENDGGSDRQPQDDRKTENDSPDDNSGDGGDNGGGDGGDNGAGNDGGNGAGQLIARGDNIIARARDEGGNRNRAAEKALKLYKKAARLGSAKANYKIGRIYQSGYGGANAPKRARQFYTKAGKAGYSQAYVTLIKMLDGSGKTKAAANVLLKFHSTSPRAAIRSLGRFDRGVLRAMQIRLRNTGYYDGAIDGDIGPGTQAAMRAFTRNKGARRKRVRQPQPERRVDQPTPEQGVEKSPPPRRTGKPITAVKLIKRAQRQFRRLGCYSGPIDGIWGSGSARAARNFNRWTSGARISERELSRRTLRILKKNRNQVCGVD